MNRFHHEESAWNVLTRTIVACRKCPRLVEWREGIARNRRRAYHDWNYWGKPVPGFGDRNARVLVVGLAPGAHGSNRTGRMFTGDSSGDFLYSALHRAGFANQSTSIQRGDGLTLNDVFVSAVCRCAPPDNKPSSQEIENCLPFLDLEMVLLERLSGIVTLGRIAFEQTLGLLRQSNPKLAKLDFSHCAVYELGGDLPWIIASYHPSRQNTQTGRLTVEMFDQVWATVHAQLEPVRKKGE